MSLFKNDKRKDEYGEELNFYNENSSSYSADYLNKIYSYKELIKIVSEDSTVLKIHSWPWA